MPTTPTPAPCLFATTKRLNPKGLYSKTRYAASIRQIFLEKPEDACGHPYHVVLEFWPHRRPVGAYQYPWHCAWTTHKVLCALLDTICDVAPGFTVTQRAFVLRSRLTTPEES